MNTSTREQVGVSQVFSAIFFKNIKALKAGPFIVRSITIYKTTRNYYLQIEYKIWAQSTKLREKTNCPIANCKQNKEKGEQKYCKNIRKKNERSEKLQTSNERTKVSLYQEKMT